MLCKGRQGALEIMFVVRLRLKIDSIGDQSSHLAGYLPKTVLYTRKYQRRPRDGKPARRGIERGDSDFVFYRRCLGRAGFAIRTYGPNSE